MSKEQKKIVEINLILLTHWEFIILLSCFFYNRLLKAYKHLIISMLYEIYINLYSTLHLYNLYQISIYHLLCINTMHTDNEGRC